MGQISANDVLELLPPEKESKPAAAGSTPAAVNTPTKSPSWWQKPSPLNFQSAPGGPELLGAFKPGGALAETGRQVKGLAKGTLQTVFDVMDASGLGRGGLPDIPAAQRLVHSAYEVAAAPARELNQTPQPGEPPSAAPSNQLTASAGAVSRFMGGDPGRARQLAEQGKYWDAAQAYGSVPLLTFGLGKLFEARAKSPAKVAAAEEARLNKRADQLTSVTGENSKEKIAELYKAVIPDLDTTIKQTGKAPKSPTELLKTMDDTMGIKEDIYTRLKQRITGRISGQPMADAIRAKAKEFMDPANSTKSVFETENGTFVEQKYTMPQSRRNRASGNFEPVYVDEPYFTQALDANGRPIPGTSVATADQFNPNTGRPNGKNIANKKLAGGTRELGRALEARARQWEKDFSIEALDGHRKYLFDIEKKTAADRIDQRTSVERMADDASEQALKDTVYGEVQGEATRMGYHPEFVKNLKTTQAKLYSLLDALGAQDVKLENADAMRRGTPLFQRANITMGVHPHGVVGTAHGIKSAMVGDPKSLKSASRNIERALPEHPPSPAINTAKLKAKRLAITGSGSLADRSDNTPTKAPPAKVTMKAPDNSHYLVPADQVEDAKAHGAVVVQ